MGGRVAFSVTIDICSIYTNIPIEQSKEDVTQPTHMWIGPILQCSYQLHRQHLAPSLSSHQRGSTAMPHLSKSPVTLCSAIQPAL